MGLRITLVVLEALERLRVTGESPAFPNVTGVQLLESHGLAERSGPVGNYRLTIVGEKIADFLKGSSAMSDQE